MSRKRLVVGSIALVSAMFAAFALAEASTQVAYPAGYREWTHVKSMVIEEGHPLYESFGGIHHLYANEAALAGYRAGKFANGSVIAFDLLEAKREGNAVTEGARKVLGVMQKDAAKFAATGGWGFEGFAGGDPAKRAVGANAEAACYGCHAAQSASDFVFSTYRD
jgi:hypothetical protein